MGALDVGGMAGGTPTKYAPKAVERADAPACVLQVYQRCAGLRGILVRKYAAECMWLTSAGAIISRSAGFAHSVMGRACGSDLSFPRFADGIGKALSVMGL